MKHSVIMPPIDDNTFPEWLKDIITFGTSSTRKGRGKQMKDSFFKEIGAILDIIIDDGPEFPVIHTEKGGYYDEKTSLESSKTRNQAHNLKSESGRKAGDIYDSEMQILLGGTQGIEIILNVSERQVKINER